MANATNPPIHWLRLFLLLVFSLSGSCKQYMLASCLSVISPFGVLHTTEVKFRITPPESAGSLWEQVFCCLVCSWGAWTFVELITPIPLARAAEIWYFTQPRQKVNRVWKSISDVRRPFLSWVIPSPPEVTSFNQELLHNSKMKGVGSNQTSSWHLLKVCYKVSFSLKKPKSFHFYFYLCFYLFIQNFILSKSLWKSNKEYFYVDGCN